MATTEQPTSEVLHLAADLIEKRGWTQGNWGGGADASSPLCLEGGIGAAMGLSLAAIQGGAGGDFKVTARNHRRLLDCPAYAAVRAYLATDLELWLFNDHVATTASEVIEVLRAAAVIEAAKESVRASELAGVSA